jgi:hypothetical protein
VSDLDPPENMWPATWLLAYRTAQFRAAWWMAVGDVLWRLRLRAAAQDVYGHAVLAQRTAEHIADDVRQLPWS